MRRQAAQRNARGSTDGRRVRPITQQVAGAPPTRLQPPLCRDGRGRRGRRRPGSVAPACRRPAPARRGAAAPDPVSDGLPDHGDRVRDRRDDGARRVPRARLRRRLQAVRRRTALHDADLRDALARRRWLLVADDRGNRRDRGDADARQAHRKGAPGDRPRVAESPHEDRRDRPADRGRALVAHARFTGGRRCAAAPRARDHRAHRGQRRGRRRDDRSDQLSQGRRDARGATCAREPCSRRW